MVDLKQHEGYYSITSQMPLSFYRAVMITTFNTYYIQGAQTLNRTSSVYVVLKSCFILTQIPLKHCHGFCNPPVLGLSVTIS